jgi:hypothetical protein
LAAANNCGPYVVQDPYDGFRVGVPAGWELSTLGGEIAVTQSTSGTQGAILYPALLTKGATPANVFNSFMRFQQSLDAKGGSTLSYQERSGPTGMPAASLTVRRAGYDLEGEATVMVLPLRTQLSSQEAVVFVYWAPQAHFSADAPTLAWIGHCYEPQSASLFRVFKDQVFTYVMPPGWVVGVENSNDLLLHNSANSATVLYSLFGPLVQGVNVSQVVDSPQTAITYEFGQLGIQVTSVLSTVVLPNQQEPTSVQGQEYMEFTGESLGKPVHGLVYVLTDTSGESTAGVVRLGLTSSSIWNPLNGGIIEMMGAVQHDFTQDLTDIQAVNREWQDFSGQVANFDDTLNSQQLVQDPTTGSYYEASYSSYNPDGPDGPGYYLPNGQVLNPVQRP